MAKNDVEMLSGLHKQRGECKRLLTNLEKKLTADILSEATIDVLSKEVDKIQAKFEPIQSSIETLVDNDEDDLAKEAKDGDAVYDRCMDIRIKLAEFSRRIRPTGSGQHGAEPSQDALSKAMLSQTDILKKLLDMQNKPSTDSNTKLPYLSLPTFDGEYTNWLTFRDAFLSSVHNNSTLQPNQKMQYLKMSLTGKAAQEISHVQTSDANYEPSWARLIERFEKKGHLLNAFIDKFMQLSRQRVDTVEELQIANRSYRQLFNGIKSLGDDCLTLDTYLIYQMKLNMSDMLRTKWEETRNAEELPKMGEFFTFMDTTVDVLERANKEKIFKQPKEVKQPAKPAKGGIKAHHTTTEECPNCSATHLLFQCDAFRNLQVEARRNVVSQKQLCFNCMRPNHSAKQCKSKSTCRTCGKNHHTLLHLPQMNPSSNLMQNSPSPAQVEVVQPSSSIQGSSNPTQQQAVAPVGLTNHHVKLHHKALLPTATVYVTDIYGDRQLCRILIDCGADWSLISEECTQKLGLPRDNGRLSVTGAGGVIVGYTRGIVRLEIASRYDPGNKIVAQAYIMSKLTSEFPPVDLTHKNWPYIDSLQLADPEYKKTSTIDIILGAEHAYGINLPQILKGNEGEPVAQLTIFGWVVAGKISDVPIDRIINLHTQCNFDELMKKFCDAETLPEKRRLTLEEKMCEKHFAETHTIDSTGRYVVRLPFKHDHEKLGQSKFTAQGRLKAMERRFQIDPELYAQYTAFMDEYESLNHMEDIQEDDKPNEECYYLPHHAVLRPSSETTKLRVVFDGSAKTTPNRPSLNDILAIGPVVQEDLLSILLRFRTHNVAFTADVEKMYRQILVAEEDRNFQRILWRKDPTTPMKVKVLNTVTYGTSAAPYLAIKVLQQIANDNEDEFPEAAQAIRASFYVDDLLGGAHSVDAAKKLMKDIQTVLKRGHFTLRKWSSNSDEVLEQIPTEMQAVTPAEVRLQSKSISALGLQWSPGQDHFSLMIDTPSHANTKRELTAAAAKVFDPLGFLAPVIIKLKIFLQALWVLGLDWNDIAPEDIVAEYAKILSQYHMLTEVRIPRLIPTHQDDTIVLHGFSDASGKAYGAVVYAIGHTADGSTTTNIVLAKSKVASLKPMSIARKELNAAVLLSNLLQKVKEIFTHKNLIIHAWTDSTTVLQWLQENPRTWEVYVANRTSVIHEVTSPSQWRHVPGEDNPADCVSRGLFPEELLQHKLWWEGPQWMVQSIDKWPLCEVIERGKLNEERKIHKVTALHTHTCEFLQQLIADHWGFMTYIRIMCYILRFTGNAQKQTGERNSHEYFSVPELKFATMFIIRELQQSHFPLEYERCKKNTHVQNNSALKTLVPFLDKNGVMRATGRLGNTKLCYDMRHPIILPYQHEFTKSIVQYTHEINCHAPVSLTYHFLRRRYWILRGKNVVTNVLKRCVKCTKANPKKESPFMGDLPAVRVREMGLFYNTGCDFAGPIMIRASRLRKAPIIKAYICIFICMATRCIHLEPVSDLSTGDFIAALDRFRLRRPKCKHIHCDNGSNFIGASGTTREERLYGIKKHQNATCKDMAEKGITFHFIPSYSPTFGGLWERGVGSVKYHLKRMVGESLLVFDELQTVLIQIEYCLNSRPLCPKTNDIGDLDPLTPANFIFGNNVPDYDVPNLLEVNPKKLARWELCKQITQNFWDRWHLEYLTSLQQRPKNWKKTKNLKPGDLVMLRDKNMMAGKWKMARILEVQPGKDNTVRSVLVRTSEGIQKRAANTMAKVPLDGEEEDEEED